MPRVKAWIHALSKEELIEALERYQLDTSGTIDELRRKLKIFAGKNPTEFHPTVDPTKISETATMTEQAITPSPTQLGETMNLVRKWGCHFTGKDPLAFLERIEELRSGYGFTNEQLFRCLPELIAGNHYCGTGTIANRGLPGEISSPLFRCATCHITIRHWTEKSAIRYKNQAKHSAPTRPPCKP